MIMVVGCGTSGDFDSDTDGEGEMLAPEDLASVLSKHSKHAVQTHMHRPHRLMRVNTGLRHRREHGPPVVAATTP